MASSMVFKFPFKFSLNRANLAMRCKLGTKDCRSLQIRKERYFVVVLAALLLLFAPRISATMYVTQYEVGQVDALQSILKEWDRTPDIEINSAAGWSTKNHLPCSGALRPSIDVPYYPGVQCLTKVLHEPCNAAQDSYNYSAFIFGLTLNDASLVGELPAAIGNITTLSTLELTGNPNLTKQLPGQIQDTKVHSLDVQNNNFSGNLPIPSNLTWTFKLDLSGNWFIGPFPTTQIGGMNFLQTLNLSSNRFEGEIPTDTLVNLTQLKHLDLSNNLFFGSVPNLTTIKNLQVLDLSRNKFNGSPPDLTTIIFLQYVNLSRNAFTGSFLLSFIYNSSLSDAVSTLDLSYNQFRGNITRALTLSLENVRDLSLKELYLDNNNFDGTLDIGQITEHHILHKKVPGNCSSGWLNTLSLMNNNITNVLSAGIDISTISTIIRLQGNPYCNNIPGNYTDEQRCFCQQICLISSRSVAKANRKVVIISSVTIVISVLPLLTIGFGTILYRNKKKKRHLLLQVQRKFEEFDVKPTIFKYNELRTATRNFHPDMKLGEGGYGAVFKGVLANGSMVAVKQLIAQSTQSSDDFLNEIILITGMRHRNLVNLKGYCLHDHQKILVYEYVDNYDISQILLRGSNTMLVDWPTRLKICLGVARGLHYLHALAQPRIIHRDIKASNVLLDKNFEAKIADFGLALLFPDNQSHIITVHVAGTKGYLAPEYALFGQLSDKVDVFSFGVLCLEVVSGRRNIDEKLPLDETYLFKWAWKLHEAGNLMHLVDSALILQDDQKLEVTRLINTALLCLQHNEEHRPTMARVVAMLQGDSEPEVVVNDEVEDQFKDSASLLQAFGRTGLDPGLDTINEELESWFATSNSSERNNSTLINPTIELGHVRDRRTDDQCQ